ncbi:MAG TPA: SRPBCC domain-containing protein [Polyangia bacterium]|nr:SRPBCC domain-containing protein [Polyangia bacterium]
MTSQPRGSFTVDYPNGLEIVMTREFDAPLALVFDVLTKREHLLVTLAPFDERVTVCDLDLRAGGHYHYVFVTRDGRECSFRGTFLEVEPPTRTVQTWRFEGWPGVEAVETQALHEAGGVTKLTNTLAFRDKAGRAHMTKVDGYQANLDKVEDHLRALLRR